MKNVFEEEKKTSVLSPSEWFHKEMNLLSNKVWLSRHPVTQIHWLILKWRGANVDSMGRSRHHWVHGTFPWGFHYWIEASNTNLALRTLWADEKAEKLKGFIIFFSTNQPLLISRKIVYNLEKIVSTPGNWSPGQKQMKEFKQNKTNKTSLRGENKKQENVDSIKHRLDSTLDNTPIRYNFKPIRYNF